MPVLTPAPDLALGRKADRKRRIAEIPTSCATVIALDPGGTTGWSLVSVQPEVLFDPKADLMKGVKLWQHGQIDCGSLKGDRGMNGYGDIDDGVSVKGEAAGVNEIISLLRVWPGAAIVIEDFIVRQFNKSRDFLAPVRITAAINQYLYNQRRGSYVQQPALAKTTMTDDRLKKFNMYERSGGAVHARDADRHAVTFLRRLKQYEMQPKLAKQHGMELDRVFPELFGEGGPYCED